jgi:hypothetical protein
MPLLPSVMVHSFLSAQLAFTFRFGCRRHAFVMGQRELHASSTFWSFKMDCGHGHANIARE